MASSVFREIIGASEEELVQRFYKYRDEVTSMGNRLQDIARKIGLRPEQLICAIGFNPHARYLTEIMPLLGYATFEELAKERNDVFISDIYKRVSLDDMLAIYASVKNDPSTLQVMQYLLKERLERVEKRIEETVNSLIIDKYRAEMRGIYSDGVADVDFADQRLNRRDSGFRALLNEVSIIIDSKLIPAGNIFFRNTILPEEKRKILNKGLIPKDLIQSRLDDHNTSPEEKQVLLEYLKTHRDA
jgi:tetrahydromethanopterin S-methyltransferase subunit G